MNSNLVHSMPSAVCKECGKPLGKETSQCQSCATPGLARQWFATLCRNFATVSTLLFALVLVTTADRNWIANLPVVVGFCTVSLLMRGLAGLVRGDATQPSRWTHVIVGLAVIGLIDWLVRSELLWGAIGVAMVGAASIAILFAIYAWWVQPATPATQSAEPETGSTAAAADTQPATTGGNGGRNWIGIIIAGIVIAALKGEFQKPANQPGKARPQQVNAQLTGNTERFWNEQIVKLALLEQSFPEPSVDQTFGEYTRSAEEYLTNGVNQIPAAHGVGVAVDTVSLFNRQRNDVIQLRDAIAAARSKSTDADLNRPAHEVIAVSDAALAANALPADDPAVSAFLALLGRLEKHDVERAALQGKLSERFPTRQFKLPE